MIITFNHLSYKSFIFLSYINESENYKMNNFYLHHLRDSISMGKLELKEIIFSVNQCEHDIDGLPRT